MHYSPEPSDTILVNGLILVDPSTSETVRHRKTVISGNRLARVNVAKETIQNHDNVIDCSDCLVMPGLINCHTHAAMSLFRGLADDLPLGIWLNDYIFPSESKHAGPEFVYLGTKLSAVEMALGGITTFADGYFHMEEAARAAKEVGLRAVLAQGILDVPSRDCPVPGSWRSRVEVFLSAFPKDPLISPALFCHSPYLCGPDTFQAAHQICAEHNLLLFSHVSETTREVDEVSKRYGLRPIELLARLGVLRKGFIGVHAIHLSDNEMDILVGSGAAVVHCPESNMKLASGAGNVQLLLDRGVTVGIGTDGPASNNNLDLFEEMRSASLMGKLISQDPLCMSARTLVHMATLGGAKALGMEDCIGSLEEGKNADLIIVDLNRPHLTPLYDPVSHVVYSAKGSDVRDVIVNGKLVVRNGKIMTVDTAELGSRIRTSAKTIGRDLGIKDYGDVS
ncbi:MAG TPA: amidohydrolase [Desulfomonilaceae bacterium]|nr:amidohydrolase [Desulfomonilaceae bacterium]